MSAAVATSMATPSGIRSLLQPDFGLGQADVDRRDIAVPFDTAARGNLNRAARAAHRHVRVLHELGDGQHERRVARQLLPLPLCGQPRRDHLAVAFEDGEVELTAPGIVVHRDARQVVRAFLGRRTFAERDRLVRRHRDDRLAEGEGEALDGGEADADAGEGAGPARGGEELDVALLRAALGEEPVDGREELLVARALALQRDGAEERAVVEERDGEQRQRGVGGEDEHRAASSRRNGLRLRHAEVDQVQADLAGDFAGALVAVELAVIDAADAGVRDQLEAVPAGGGGSVELGAVDGDAILRRLQDRVRLGVNRGDAVPFLDDAADVLAVREAAGRAVVPGGEDGPVADDDRSHVLAGARGARRRLARDAHEVFVPACAHSGPDYMWPERRAGSQPAQMVADPVCPIWAGWEPALRFPPPAKIDTTG